ncbi:transglutaminase-like domain-containing protein [Desnuesiella massiliensis]|uniref:transglutaminase-like domain-containing protein n=1 Tax=Desnuesiella massiliensis TaxID=1650662 RepID=UPI0006E3B9C7|nr:transglutaminase-like domain-containing protein [Desnuesiella massiliensis]
MRFNPISFLFILVLIIPLVRGFMSKFNSDTLKNDLRDIEKSISFVASMFLAIYINKNIFIEHNWDISFVLPKALLEYLDKHVAIIYILILPLIMYILYIIILFVIELLNKITFYPIFDNVERHFRNKNNFSKRMLGFIFEIPRAFCYVLILAFAFNFMSIINLNSILNGYLEQSKLYSYVCKQIVIPLTNSPLARQLPYIINNSFKIEVKQNALENNLDYKNSKIRQVIYYNGITLEEGIKSNTTIDNFAKDIVLNYKNDKSKARALYNWIGSNIDYDYNKANLVLNNNFSVPSGAIPTFDTKKGICFDYACLYVAMARATGLKVRMVTGEGFNGVSWVSHAWNQVYISEEDKWINVDATFYKGGNYFNSRRFDLDHKGDKIIGEW